MNNKYIEQVELFLFKVKNKLGFEIMRITIKLINWFWKCLKEFSVSFEFRHLCIFLVNYLLMFFAHFLLEYFSLIFLKAFLARIITLFQSFILKIFYTICHLTSIVYGLSSNANDFKFCAVQSFHFPLWNLFLCLEKSSLHKIRWIIIFSHYFLKNC